MSAALTRELGALHLGDAVSVPLAAGGRATGEIVAYRGGLTAGDERRVLIVKLADGTLVPAPAGRCRAVGPSPRPSPTRGEGEGAAA